MMGLAWLLDAPKLVLAKVPERGRSQLLIMSVFLNFWQGQEMQEVIDYM
ncbi:hypothetical protein [Pseudomaricurvus sp.]